MLAPTTVSFLQTKIQELRSALFYSMNDAVLRLPTTVVTALKVDDVGQIWFFVHRPKQQLEAFAHEFPSRLEFFRKGRSFNLKISGKALIVNDPEELNSLVSLSEEVRLKAMGQLVLVKFCIQCADYFEHSSRHPQTWMTGFKSRLFKLLYKEHPAFKPYRLEQSF